MHTYTTKQAWRERRCARRAQPTSVSCLERGTCLPIGGFSVWSLNNAAMLDSPSSPATPGQRGRVVMVTANLDSSALFHDLAVGFAAEASALVALIAAADALRAFRANMASHQGAAVLFAALQVVSFAPPSLRSVPCARPRAVSSRRLAVPGFQAAVNLARSGVQGLGLGVLGFRNWSEQRLLCPLLPNSPLAEKAVRR